MVAFIFGFIKISTRVFGVSKSGIEISYFINMFKLFVYIFGGLVVAGGGFIYVQLDTRMLDFSLLYISVHLGVLK